MSADGPFPSARGERRHKTDGLRNFDAERALLAALLARNELWYKAAEIVRPEHFADPLHGRIFSAIGRTLQAGSIANVVTLKAEFDSDPALADQGGAKYLAILSASVVTLHNIADYGEVIRDLWMRRELADRAEALKAAAGSSDASVESMIAGTIGDLHGLSAQGKQTAQSKRAVAESLVNSIMQPAAVYPTGLGGLDEALGGGLFAGKMVGVSARKKVGKTVLLGTISHNLACAGFPHHFIALEMSPAEIEQRNAARELGINSIAFLKEPTKELARRVADYACGIADAALYESAPGASLDEVRRMVSRAVVTHGVKGVILDYWQLVGGKARNETEEYHLRNVAQWLADACRKHGLWCLIAAQQNQDGNSRGGEGLRLACDVYFALNREKGSDGAWLDMQESRYLPYQNVGSAETPGLWLNHHGPFFEDAAGITPGGRGNDSG
jgi:replicative DNA helicase